MIGPTSTEPWHLPRFVIDISKINTDDLYDLKPGGLVRCSSVGDPTHWNIFPCEGTTSVHTYASPHPLIPAEGELTYALSQAYQRQRDAGWAPTFKHDYHPPADCKPSVWRDRIVFASLWLAVLWVVYKHFWGL